MLGRDGAKGPRVMRGAQGARAPHKFPENGKKPPFLQKNCGQSALGRPRITPSVKCLAPDAFSGAKLQVLMKNGQKNEIEQGLRAPDRI